MYAMTVLRLVLLAGIVACAGGQDAEGTCTAGLGQGCGSPAGALSRDHLEKLGLLRKMLKEEGVDCLLVTQTFNFAWLTGGRNFVPLDTETGNSQLFVDQERAVVVTTAIEYPRMSGEECVGFEVMAADWRQLPLSMDDIVASLAHGRAVEPDTGRLAGRLEALQVQLSAGDLEEVRKLGADLGAAIAEAAHAIQVGDTEYQAVGHIANAYLKRRIDPIALMVAFDERASQHRHPLPRAHHEGRLKRWMLMGTVGRRKGLMLSVSRMVSFGPVPEDMRAKHQACMEVDAEINLNTVPGKTADELYSVLEKAYASRGFADEIRLHHQGGLTGYKARHWIAQPGGKQVVAGGTVYAWNPSITGTKSEDSIYVPTEGGPLEILTASPDWPLVNVTLSDGRTMPRPDILVRAA